MNVSEIIGKTITDIRNKLKSIEGDLDYFESYLTLTSKIRLRFLYLEPNLLKS
jgi:hypothetical protein